jgi:hypothetical protein
MARGRSSLIISVLLLGTVVPSLRCLIPTETLSAEEQACCKRMAGECGSMPASHECCKKVVSGPQPAMTSSKTTLPAPVAVVGTPLLEERQMCVQPLALVVTELLDPSPPPNTIAVLRI